MPRLWEGNGHKTTFDKVSGVIWLFDFGIYVLFGDHVSLIFVHIVSVYLFSPIVSVPFLFFAFYNDIQRNAVHILKVNQMSPPVSLHLLVTCGHVCMTEEMQSLAQTIKICLVCKIYMKSIFIHAGMHIASLSFILPLSYSHAFTQSFVLTQEVFQMKTSVSLMSLISYIIAHVAFYLPLFIHKCTWIIPCMLLLQERAEAAIDLQKNPKRFYIICFSEGEKAGGKCIFSSHVIIVAR